MLGMSQEQIMGLLRQILPVLGTLLVSLGVVKQGTWDSFFTLILTIAGPLMIVASAVWSTVDKTQAALVAKVDALAKEPASPVLGVVMANNIEGRELAESLPGKTTVVAGSNEAVNLVRTAA